MTDQRVRPSPLALLPLRVQHGVRALFLAPTRELASQIFREVERLSRGKAFRSCLLSKAVAATGKARCGPPTRHTIALWRVLRLTSVCGGAMVAVGRRARWGRSTSWWPRPCGWSPCSGRARWTSPRSRCVGACARPCRGGPRGSLTLGVAAVVAMPGGGDGRGRQAVRAGQGQGRRDGRQELPRTDRRDPGRMLARQGTLNPASST